MPELKLYRAYSILEEFKGYRDVTRIWFFYDRKVPVAPYEKLIEDYNGSWKTELEHKRHERERCVNQFFTDHEIQALSTYFEKEHPNWGMQVEDISVPLPNNLKPFPLGDILPVKPEEVDPQHLWVETEPPLAGASQRIFFYILSQEPKYSLPFVVLGFVVINEEVEPYRFDE